MCLLTQCQFGQKLDSQADKRYTFYFNKTPIKYPNGKRGYLGLLSHKLDSKLRVGYDYNTKLGTVSLAAILKSSNGQPTLLVIDSNNTVQQVSPLLFNEEVGLSRITAQVTADLVMKYLQPAKPEKLREEPKLETTKNSKPKPLQTNASEDTQSNILNEFRIMSKSFTDLAKVLTPATPSTPSTPATPATPATPSTPTNSSTPATPLYNPMQFPWLYPALQWPNNYYSNQQPSQRSRSHHRRRSRRRSRHSYSRSSSPSYSSSQSSSDSDSPRHRRQHRYKAKRHRSPSPYRSYSPSRHNDRRSKKPKRT